MIIRRNFEDQLSELQAELLRLGRFVTDAHGKAMDALVRQDLPLAKSVIGDDDIADDLTFAIQSLGMQLLALQQPMARDLRSIASGLRIVVDLERIGDHAVDIAKITRTLAGYAGLKLPADLPRLSQMASQMVGDSLQAFVQRDALLARQVARDDDAVDDLCEEIQRELMDRMRQDPANVDGATRLLLVARSLERVADHATNIAEHVYYVETGEMRHLAREEHNHALLSSLGVDENQWSEVTAHQTPPPRKEPGSGA